MFENGVTEEITARHYKIQTITSLVGVVFALILAALDYKKIAKIWFIFAPFALILQGLLFTSLGKSVNAADDIGWLNLGFTTIQPSELLKTAFIVTFALHLSKLGPKINNVFHLVLVGIHGMIPTGLVMLQGDDGTCLVFLGVFLIMLFAAGLWWRYVAIIAALIPVGAFVMWTYVMKSFQKLRFLVVYDKATQEAEARGLYYQQLYALRALGSGEMTGKGLDGQGYTYIPVVESDFIYAYVGMTLGFIGCIAVAAVILLICGGLIRVSFASKDDLGKLICVGVFAVIFVHSVINIGMVLSVVPVVGIPLPFISAGGTQTLALFLDIGLVLSVYSHRYTKRKHMFYEENDKAVNFRI
jgi:rod shape determining protein RodA